MSRLDGKVAFWKMANYFHVGQRTIDGWIANGCPHLSVGKRKQRHLRFSIPEVEAWLRTQEIIKHAPAPALLLECERLGVKIETRGDGRLYFNAPHGVVTPSLREALHREKPAILKLLLPNPPPPSAPPGPVSVLAPPATYPPQGMALVKLFEQPNGQRTPERTPANVGLVLSPEEVQGLLSLLSRVVTMILKNADGEALGVRTKEARVIWTTLEGLLEIYSKEPKP